MNRQVWIRLHVPEGVDPKVALEHAKRAIADIVRRDATAVPVDPARPDGPATAVPTFSGAEARLVPED